MSKGLALQESAMHSPLEPPPPPETPSSTDEVIELLVAESQVYREMTQVLLGQLFESNRRERHRRGGSAGVATDFSHP